MIDVAVNGIVLRTKSKALNDLGTINVLGKTLEQWAGAAIGAPYKAVECSPVVNMAERVRDAIDRKKPTTVVLFCDTPLVSHNTVAAAVKELESGAEKALKLPRGYVFRTDYLFEIESLFFHNTTADKEFDTVTDSESLSRVTEVLRRRILRFHSDGGVVIPSFEHTTIDCDAVIMRGAVIEPYNFIKGKTVIKENAHIMPGNYIENCVIGAGARVDSSRLYNSCVGDGTTVGPFAYIRPDSVIGAHCRIGDFVELKSCVIGNNTKVSHLTYIGDAELGEECNVGCGVVFANYDGKNKYKSVVGNRVFIGSNANIVAPVEISDRSFIAAGSTITKSVPSSALAIARARQSIIPNWSGNMYAPPIPEAPVQPTYNVVQYSDGIIDGSASDNVNSTDETKD
ncbi:MAG: hypothetical protein J1G04_03765 [Clostridiales bacterium]|nr:hypothetical protein [Clostridiales bacterium]